MRTRTPSDIRPRESFTDIRRPPFAAGSIILAMSVVFSLASSNGAWPATVTGSVTTSLASVRVEGPKHDLDVVVALSPIDGPGSPPGSETMTMDQLGLVFIPHVLAIQKGTTVTFLNNDNDQHNVYFLDDRTGETLDIGTWGPGVSVDHRFEKTGLVIALCKLHLEMAAYIVVLEHPWFAPVKLDSETRSASFTVEGVPPGEYELTAWHKKLKQKGGATRLTVVEGDANNAEIVMTPAKYAGKTK